MAAACVDAPPERAFQRPGRPTIKMSWLFRKLVRPALFALNPETAHELGIDALRIGLGTPAARSVASRVYGSDFSYGPIERFGLRFDNPLGIAAGFDKNGVAVDALAALGFGFVEVGTVTLRPQSGNPKPRLFRLVEDRALINRLGFNNDGVERVAERLRRRPHRCVVGINIGKNRDVSVEDAVPNYLDCLRLAHSAADYVAVNVSSPNTPNLRELQRPESLRELLRELQSVNAELSGTSARKPLFVKIAPDVAETDVETIVGIALELELAGVIATNTTVDRGGLRSSVTEAGGLSGAPLRDRATGIVRLAYRYSNGRLPIIGVGGIFSAEDAFEKIAAGASLVQAYTGFVYGGPSFARENVRGLDAILKRQGFASYEEAIGSRARP